LSTTPDFEGPPFLRRLQREYEDVTEAYNRLSASEEPCAEGRSIYIRQLIALDECRDRMAAKLQEIGTQAALVAMHDGDHPTSISAASLCRNILVLLNELKLGIA
jgi:hypothetical protein